MTFISASVLHIEPTIIHIPIDSKRLDVAADILQHFPKPYHILASPTFCYPDDELISILKYLSVHGNTTFLSCREQQVEDLNNLGLDAIFCHHNSFLSSRIHKYDYNIKKLYNAVYNAQIVPLKRHELSIDVDDILYLSYTEDEQYRKHILRQRHKKSTIKQHIQITDMYKYHNSSKVGLCLSYDECGMKACGEYLLSGLPVVYTESRYNERNFFLDHTNSVFCRDDPQEISDAVKNLCDNYNMLDSNKIRNDMIARQQIGLNNIKEKIGNILQKDEKYLKNCWSKSYNNNLLHYDLKMENFVRKTYERLC